MFGIGVWEIVIIGIVGLIFCGATIAAIIVAIGVASGSRHRGPDERQG